MRELFPNAHSMNLLVKGQGQGSDDSHTKAYEDKHEVVVCQWLGLVHPKLVIPVDRVVVTPDLAHEDPMLHLLQDVMVHNLKEL